MAALKESVPSMNAPCHGGSVPGDKDRSLCQLIHDARNHLNAVKGLGLILGDSSTHPSALMYRDCLQSEAHHLAELLECIRTNLSGQDEVLPQSEWFDPVEHLKLIAHANQPLAERVGIQLVLGAPAEMSRVKGKPCLLKRMLTNLLSNAIQHSQATLIHLTVSGAASACGTGVRLSYRVSDNGVGTNTCASSSATPVTKKNGHGLAICHRLAGELGATFELSDAVPSGLTARIDVTLERDKGTSS